jgi:hypothetical protein
MQYVPDPDTPATCQSSTRGHSMMEKRSKVKNRFMDGRWGGESPDMEYAHLVGITCFVMETTYYWDEKIELVGPEVQLEVSQDLFILRGLNIFTVLPFDDRFYV